MERTSGIERLKSLVESDFENNQSKFARAINKPQSSVYELLTGERKKIPAEWCLAIERATGGKVTRHELRPDLYPQEAAQ